MPAATTAAPPAHARGPIPSSPSSRNAINADHSGVRLKMTCEEAGEAGRLVNYMASMSNANFCRHAWWAKTAGLLLLF